MGATAIKYLSPKEYLEAEVLADEKHEYVDGNIAELTMPLADVYNRVLCAQPNH